MNRRRLILKRNSSTVLTVFGAIGVVATTVAAVRASPKVDVLIEQAEREKGEKLTKWEAVKTAAPEYLPTMLLGVTTIVCIFGANVFNKRHQASLASAYGLLDQSYKKYRNKLIELYGEDTHNKIIDEINAEEAEPRYVQTECMFTNCRQFLDEDYSRPILFCINTIGTRKFFTAPLEQVLLAEYHLNRNFTMSGTALVNELYNFLGLEETKEGEEIGWMIEDEFTWIDFNHRKCELRDGTEYYLIETPFEPTAEWQECYYL